MRKIFTLLSVVFLCQWVIGQNVLTSANGNYSQNFDEMQSTATLPANWVGVRYAGNGTTALVMVVTATNPSTGAIYNAGTVGSTDRTLATLASGSTIPAFGTSFINSTSSPITGFSFTGFMEQWKSGSSATVNEKVVFEYSLDATDLVSGTWTTLPSMDLVEKLTTSTSAVLVNGNLAENRTAITGTITGLNLGINNKLWIRWRDTDDSGSDGMYGVDDFSMSYTNGGPDTDPPTISTLTPLDNANDVLTNQNFSINFSENIQKGTGNIYLKKADGTIVQTLDVTSSVVSISNNVASFNFGTLDLSSSYYIEVNAGAFKDLSNNNFAGISGNTAWNFTTTSTFLSFNFNTCTSYAPVVGGFTQYSVVGDSIWKCTTFGNNSTGGVQMNGYNNATTSNDANEDWLISPALDLSGTNIPMLRFSAINAFTGPQLRLFISTNYTPGTAPSTASWTELNGKFPAQNSRAWTVSDSISLAGYAQNGVYLAWVYYSTTSAAARWTLDDVSVFNSTVAPSPDITIAPNSINFGYIAGGTTSYWQSVTFNSSNLSGDLTLSTSAPFQLSTDTAAGNVTSITYPLANVSGTTQTFYVRFAPAVSDQVYSNAITASASNYNKAVVSLNGLSVPVSKTLEIVNWNMEWFGSPDPTLGPTNKDLQFTNALKVLRYLDADIYSLVEIVDTSRFRKLADSLGTDYGYIVCNYGTRAIDPNNASYNTNIATAQKEGFIYKKSIFSNVTARPFLLTSYADTTIPSSYYWWSSGRFPYIMETDANVNGVTKHLTFVLLHAKANTGDVAAQIESYNRRKAGVLNMKDSLDLNYSNANIIILGDYNDKLIGTIAPTTAPDTASSYKAFVIDSTDGNSYKSITLPFVNTGSTVGGNADIDNVIISNELVPFFLNGSAQIRSDAVSLIGNATTYSNTTTDHYPIYTRYFFGSPILPVKLLSFTGKRQGTTSALQWQVTAEENVDKYEVEGSSDARQFKTVGTVLATSSNAATKTYQLTDPNPINGYNYYRLKMIDKDGKAAYSSVVKIYFGKEWQVSISPNPAKDVLFLQTSQAAKLTISLYDAAGRKVKQFTNLAFGQDETRQLSLSHLQRGTYTVEILSATNRVVNKIVVE